MSQYLAYREQVETAAEAAGGGSPSAQAQIQVNRKGKKLFQHFVNVKVSLPQAALLLQQQQQAAAQVQGVKLSAAGVGAAAAAVEKQLKRMPSSGQVRHSFFFFLYLVL